MFSLFVDCFYHKGPALSSTTKAIIIEYRVNFPFLGELNHLVYQGKSKIIVLFHALLYFMKFELDHAIR